MINLAVFAAATKKPIKPSTDKTSYISTTQFLQQY